MAVITTGKHHRAETAQSGAHERSDDHFGLGWGRRHETRRFEAGVDPSDEVGEVEHRVGCRCLPGGAAAAAVQAQRGQHGATRRISVERGEAGRGGSGQSVGPLPQAAPPWAAKGDKALLQALHSVQSQGRRRTLVAPGIFKRGRVARGLQFHGLDQSIAASTQRRCAKPGHDMRGGTGGRQRPARLVCKRHASPLEQGADAPHDQAVLGNQGHRRIAPGQSLEHGQRRGIGLGLQIFSPGTSRRRQDGSQIEGLSNRRTDVEPKRRHASCRRLIQQARDEPIVVRPAHRDPRCRPMRPQAIGDARISCRGPLQSQAGEPTFRAARP